MDQRREAARFSIVGGNNGDNTGNRGEWENGAARGIQTPDQSGVNGTLYR